MQEPGKLVLCMIFICILGNKKERTRWNFEVPLEKSPFLGQCVRKVNIMAFGYL